MTTHSEIEYLRRVAWWLALELDNSADAVGPVPDLVEQSLRGKSKLLHEIVAGEFPDCRPFGPAPLDAKR